MWGGLLLAGLGDGSYSHNNVTTYQVCVEPIFKCHLLKVCDADQHSATTFPLQLNPWQQLGERPLVPDI